MSNKYYDRDGNEISISEWVSLYESNDLMIQRQFYFENKLELYWDGLSIYKFRNVPLPVELRLTDTNSTKPETDYKTVMRFRDQTKGKKYFRKILLDLIHEYDPMVMFDETFYLLKILQMTHPYQPQED